jgi:hypothetical protein
MKQWLLSSDKIFLSGKSHACCHIPRQMCSLGPHILNDTDQGESVHVMDKVDYRRTSKRYSQTNTELVKLVMRGIRSQTMLAAYYASKTTSDRNEQLSPPKYRLIRTIENSFMRFERITKLWLFESNDVELCPLLLARSSLTSLFVEFANRSDDNRDVIVDLMKVNNSEYCMCMSKGISFVTDERDSGMKTFRVYATLDFADNKPRFDLLKCVLLMITARKRCVLAKYLAYLQFLKKQRARRQSDLYC